MKKKTLILGSVCLMLAVLLVVAGCSQPAPEAPPQESAWEITVKSAGGEKVIAIEDIKAMEAVTIEAEKKEEVHEYTGVKLSEILGLAEIGEAETVTLEAEDGYSATLTGAEAFSDNTLLAYQIDGADIESDKSKPIMLVSTEASSSAWVGKLKVITVE